MLISFIQLSQPCIAIRYNTQHCDDMFTVYYSNNIDQINSFQNKINSSQDKINLFENEFSEDDMTSFGFNPAYNARHQPKDTTQIYILPSYYIENSNISYNTYHSYIEQVYQLRAKIFGPAGNGWIDPERGMDIDEYDTPKCTYVLVVHNDIVYGFVRILLTSENSMVRNTLGSKFDCPNSPDVGEISRLCAIKLKGVDVPALLLTGVMLLGNKAGFKSFISWTSDGIRKKVFNRLLFPAMCRFNINDDSIIFETLVSEKALAEMYAVNKLNSSIIVIPISLTSIYDDKQLENIISNKSHL